MGYGFENMHGGTGMKGDEWSREEGCEKSEVWLSIGIHACGNNGDKLMD